MDRDSEAFAGAPNAVLEQSSFLFGTNAAYVEALYAQYLENPDAVDPSWRGYFASLGEEGLSAAQLGRGPAWRRDAKLDLETGDLTSALTGQPEPRAKGAVSETDLRAAAKESISAIQLVRAYRVIGHLAADLDPLKLGKKTALPQLDPNFYGFHDAELDKPVFTGGVLGMESASPRRIVEILRRTYCGTIGYEFMHINDPEQKDWLQRRIEGPDKEISFTKEGKRAILNKLIEAEGFEKFASLRFVGTKRFGLDGGEAMVPALEQIIKRGGQLGVKEIVLGMSHRGRLNVLANVMAKPYRQIFHEFQGGSVLPTEVQGSGDVKYHLGASSDREFDCREGASIAHCEPFASRGVRSRGAGQGARQANATGRQQNARQRDAAAAPWRCGVCGPGRGGGMFRDVRHQGFSHRRHDSFRGQQPDRLHDGTAYARSSPYPSDVALMVQAPIFHVNGDDPEAVVHVARIATEFRQLFHKDVVIDMFCYRRFGHNETDEPAFTQPLMYRAIKEHPTTLELYAAKLVAEGTLTEDDVRAMIAAFQKRLDEELDQAKNHRPNRADWLDGRWSGFAIAPEGDRRGETAVPLADLMKVGHALSTAPESFHLHRTIARQLQAKAQMFETGKGFDWATGEALAFGTLLNEGCPVRLSGQDTSRGTFSQRHAALVDQENEERYLAARPYKRRPGRIRSGGFAPFRRSCAGLRIWLQLRGTARAGALGSAIRRFRQRRASRDRPVHRIRRNEMAAHVRPRDAAAARL